MSWWISRLSQLICRQTVDTSQDFQVSTVNASWLRLLGLFFGLDCVSRSLDLDWYFYDYREQLFETVKIFLNYWDWLQKMLSISVLIEIMSRQIEIVSSQIETPRLIYCTSNNKDRIKPDLSAISFKKFFLIIFVMVVNF